jgi:glycosyltransferase involved in cell wall biosynthesis
LQAIAQQRLDKESFEVIVADDGSSDNTKAVVDQYRSRLKLKYFFQEDNGYCPGSARNMGIRNAEGELIILVDCGVLLSSGCVEAHINAHAASADPVAVVGYVYCYDQGNDYGDLLLKLIDPHNPDAATAHFRSTTTFLDLREEYYARYNDKLDDLPAPWAFFWTCNVSMNRQLILEKAGLFDPGFDGKWGVEDLDMGYRLHKSGARLVLNRAADAVHYPHHKIEAQRYLEEEINKVYFHAKHQSPESALMLSCNPIDLNDRLREQAAASRRKPSAGKSKKLNQSTN